MFQKSKKETSYGVIPLQKRGGKWHTFLIKQVHGHFWGFPKGHPNPEESPLETATRELLEETALTLVKMLWPEPFSETYFFFHKGIKIEKTVEYFVAEVEGDFTPHPQEVEEGEWFDLDSAIDKATYTESKRILAEIKGRLAG